MKINYKINVYGDQYGIDYNKLKLPKKYLIYISKIETILKQKKIDNYEIMYMFINEQLETIEGKKITEDLINYIQMRITDNEIKKILRLEELENLKEFAINIIEHKINYDCEE